MSKLYYILEDKPYVAYEVEPQHSRAPEEELIHLSPRAVHRANFAGEPVIIEKYAKGSIVRVEA